MHPKELRRHLLIALLSPVLAAASATGAVDLRAPEARGIVIVVVLLAAAFAAGLLIGRVTQCGRS
jgi:hypothetical protein